MKHPESGRRGNDGPAGVGRRGQLLKLTDGASITGVYRKLFAERGKHLGDIGPKIDAICTPGMLSTPIREPGR